MQAKLTIDERIALIQAGEKEKYQARRWHAELMGAHVAYVYDPKGNIMATLDDTHADVKRDQLALLRHAVIMASACESHLEKFGEELCVEVVEEQRRSSEAA